MKKTPAVPGPEQRVAVGRIVGAFGIRGQLKVEPLTEFLERFDSGRRLLLEDRWVEVRDAFVQKDRLIVTLSGIDSRNDAEALQWRTLEALADEAPELDEDEYLSSDLVGLAVVTEDGRRLGNVSNVLAYPAHDILEVGSLMIPAVRQFVLGVDMDRGEILVRLIPGMEPGTASTD